MELRLHKCINVCKGIFGTLLPSYNYVFMGNLCCKTDVTNPKILAPRCKFSVFTDVNYLYLQFLPMNTLLNLTNKILLLNCPSFSK